MHLFPVDLTFSRVVFLFQMLIYLFLSSVKEMEHLDWNARMRIVMGIAYCLQYMHHDLNPPVAHSHLTSSVIFLTDDYAGKVRGQCLPQIQTSLFITLSA